MAASTSSPRGPRFEFNTYTPSNSLRSSSSRFFAPAQFVSLPSSPRRGFRSLGRAWFSSAVSVNSRLFEQPPSRSAESSSQVLLQLDFLLQSSLFVVQLVLIACWSRLKASANSSRSGRAPSFPPVLAPSISSCTCSSPLRRVRTDAPLSGSSLHRAIWVSKPLRLLVFGFQQGARLTAAFDSRRALDLASLLNRLWMLQIAQFG